MHMVQQGPTVAQGILFIIMWQPAWEGSLEENGYMDKLAPWLFAAVRLKLSQ